MQEETTGIDAAGGDGVHSQPASASSLSNAGSSLAASGRYKQADRSRLSFQARKNAASPPPATIISRARQMANRTVIARLLVAAAGITAAGLLISQLIDWQIESAHSRYDIEDTNAVGRRINLWLDNDWQQMQSEQLYHAPVLPMNANPKSKRPLSRAYFRLPKMHSPLAELR